MKSLATLLLGTLLAAPALAGTFTLSPDYSRPETVDATIDAVESGVETAADWQRIFQQTYSVPYGYAYSPVYDFGAAGQAVDAVKVELFVEPGRVCGASLYSVDVATSPTQTLLTRYAPNQFGEVSLPNATIYKLLIVLAQPRPRGGDCVVRLSAKGRGTDGGGGGGTDGGDFALAGVLPYAGGYVYRLSMPVSSADKVVRFRVEIPAFCAGTSVLEAGTVTEGQYETARVVDAVKHIYEVNAGAGSRVSSIDVSLNGPARTDQCGVPVYLQKKIP